MFLHITYDTHLFTAIGQESIYAVLSRHPTTLQAGPL